MSGRACLLALPLIIATRPSMLALWQAEHVKSLLESRHGARVTLKRITTKGDKILDRSLVDIGGKGLFLKEIEDALLAGKAQIAVHSLKDVPYELPPGLTLAAILPRDDPRDAFIGRTGATLKDLPEGARVGTTSLRRKVQLKRLYPHLEFPDVRGNVDTRLKKLDAGEFDGVVLALAGLKRLGWTSRVGEIPDIVPAVGQGAIAVECRADDVATLAILRAFNDAETARCVGLEREYLRLSQGSCRTPIGCHVSTDADHPERFVLRHFLARPDGTVVREGTITGIWEEAGTLVGMALTCPSA